MPRLGMSLAPPVWTDSCSFGLLDPVWTDTEIAAEDHDYVPDLDSIEVCAAPLVLTDAGHQSVSQVVAFLDKHLATVSPAAHVPVHVAPAGGVGLPVRLPPPDPEGPRCPCDFVEISLADLDFDKLEDHFFDFVFGYAAPGLSVKGAAPLLVPCIPAGYADEVDLIDFAAFVLVELAAAGFPVHFGLLADAKATRAPLAVPATAGALVDPVLPAHLDLAVADGPGVLDHLVPGLVLPHDVGHDLGLGPAPPGSENKYMQTSPPDLWPQQHESVGITHEPQVGAEGGLRVVSEEEKKRISKLKDMYKPLTDWWKDTFTDFDLDPAFDPGVDGLLRDHLAGGTA